MTRPAHRTGADRRWIAEYGVIALAICLAWQMLVALMAERAPVEVAVRFAPASTRALVRAAESEFVAGRVDNAVELARSAVRIAPFDARALSIIGRGQDAAGRRDAADQTLTLAGNWSLRDDPAHAWLMNRRLQMGDYASSFAHADTLLRRQSQSEPRLFELFTVAADQQAGLSALLQTLSSSAPWRQRYLTYLVDRDGSDALLAALALNLQSGARPLTDIELGLVYTAWLARGRLPAIRAVQAQLGRPRLTGQVWNGGFAPGPGIYPLNWTFGAAPGLSALVADTDETRQGGALYAEFDGSGTGIAVSQLILLSPGPATIRLRQKVAGDLGDAGLEWRIVCVEGGVPLVRLAAAESSASGWSELSAPLTVPSAGCSAQRLQLIATPGDRRRAVTAWFDDVSIQPRAAG